MIKEVTVSSAIEKEKQPDQTYIDILDAYAGCQLQCPYCFQRSNNEWCKDILVRTNIAEVLDEQIMRAKIKQTGELFIGSLSDPYMPLEEEYGLTRKMLEVLCDKDYDVFITTKMDNALILRDIDLMKRFKRPIKILLGLSKMEAAHEGAAHPNISVASELKRQGIDVQIFITPVLPYIMKLEDMINAIDKEIPIYIDKLRVFTEGNQDQKMYEWIKENYPEYVEAYHKILFEQDESYYKKLVNTYKENSRITFMFELWNE